MRKFNCTSFAKTGNLPDKLKLAAITPVFKKNNPLEKENCRSVSVLPVASKIFERIMQKQVTHFTEKRLSPYLYGYRKAFSIQQALTIMLLLLNQSTADSDSFSSVWRRSFIFLQVRAMVLSSAKLCKSDFVRFCQIYKNVKQDWT